MIDAFISQPHYLQHLAPIWHALPDTLRGSVYAGQNWADLTGCATGLGIVLEAGRPPYDGGPILMASGADLWAWQSRPVILVEHGAGQTYNVDGADNACYTAGTGRNAIGLYLCPNERIAAQNLAAYPTAQAAVIGDPTIVPTPAVAVRNCTVAVSWHWPAPLCPESGCTWPWWAGAALKLAESFDVLGHAHPKIQYKILPWWEQHEIPTVIEFADVARHAAVYVVDNSSTGMEFAATGRPIVWLNAPSYRRSVDHGGRFWEWAEMAVNCDDDARLPWAIEEALKDPPEIADRRAEWCDRVYPLRGAAATQAAIDAIVAFVS